MKIIFVQYPEEAFSNNVFPYKLFLSGYTSTWSWKKRRRRRKT
jgi:hypothetical protein